MKDKQFLTWIHERLEHVHGENHNVDYMHKLRNIILATHSEQVTPSLVGADIEPSGLILSKDLIAWVEDNKQQHDEWYAGERVGSFDYIDYNELIEEFKIKEQ